MGVVSFFESRFWKSWAHFDTISCGKISRVELSGADLPISGNGEALRSVEPGTMVFEGGKSSVSAVNMFMDYVVIYIRASGL